MNDLQSYLLIGHSYIVVVQFSNGQRLEFDIPNVAIKWSNTNLGEWTTELNRRKQNVIFVNTMFKTFLLHLE